MVKNAALFCVVVLLLTACSAAALPLAPAPVPDQPVAVTSVPTRRVQVTIPPTFTPTIAPFATATLVPPTQEPVLVMQGPGKIICPILLYHHVAVSPDKSPYYIPPTEFRAQMQALKDWGYTSIPATLLVKAINFGAELPARPVVITFDDGDLSVYTNAFPIMKEFGFTGVNYLVANYDDTDGYMTTNELKELAAAGWEAGSHTMTHADLTHSGRPEWEVAQSRHTLEKLLGVPVETFAYPYGRENADTIILVKDNYRAGMGLGAFLGQAPGNLFYLWRRPVMPGWDLQTFGSFLPWSGTP